MDTVRILLLDASPSPHLASRISDILTSSFDSRLRLDRERLDAPSDQTVWDVVHRAPRDIAMVVLGRDTLSRLCLSPLLQDGRKGPHPPLVAVVEGSEPRDVARLLRAGWADYVTPPLSESEVLPRLLRLLPPAPRRNGKTPPQGAPGCERLVGRNRAFVTEVEKMPVIAKVDSGVLIQGETGTGKELFARAIHDLSPRARRPFVPVNCGAIPVELAESELFGHERGAFTNAYSTRAGMVAQANGGTLFLDEVASLPQLAQVKLLRFLQEKEYRPLGAGALRRADVRVIAAATKLDHDTLSGHFRQDLFYRLDIVRVTLPPLRERREDIPLLAETFITRHARKLGREIDGLSDTATEKLVRYDWPGNVRELEHVIERAVIFCTGLVIDSNDVVLPQPTDLDPMEEPFQQAKARTVARFERNYIESLLAANRGNISRAARSAGKNRRAFFELIRKHQIDVERFRPVFKSVD